MSDDPTPTTNRRTVLKSVPAVAGLGAVPAAAARDSGPTFEDYLEALQRRREEDWSLAHWYDRLEELDVDYGNSREDLADSDGIDGPTKQDIALFEPADLTLTMTYENFPGDYEASVDAIELKWEFDTGIDDTYTGEPKDGVKIGYEDKYYDKPASLDGSDGYEFGSDSVLGLAGNDAYSERGLAAEYEGLYIDIQNPLIGDGETGGDLDRKDWMKVFVEPNFDYSAGDRTIYFGYTMTYDNAELTGTTISSDGVIGFDVANESASWSEVVAYEESDITDGVDYSP